MLPQSQFTGQVQFKIISDLHMVWPEYDPKLAPPLYGDKLSAVRTTNQCTHIALVLCHTSNVAQKMAVLVLPSVGSIGTTVWFRCDCHEIKTDFHGCKRMNSSEFWLWTLHKFHWWDISTSSVLQLMTEFIPFITRDRPPVYHRNNQWCKEY